MTKVSIKGVLIGGVLDIVATNILMIPFILFVMIRFDFLKGVPPGALVATIRSHGALFALQVSIGMFCSALGGYVAAAIAKQDELLNGLVSSWLCLAFGVYSIVAGKNSDSFWVQLLSFAASPICGLVGGYVRRTRKLSPVSPMPAV